MALQNTSNTNCDCYSMPAFHRKIKTSQKITKCDNLGTARYSASVLLCRGYDLVKITDGIVSLIIREGNIVYVGTVDLLGIPNISPRYVMAILDDEKIVFADAFANKTFMNIKSWSKITAAVVDKTNRSGFQLKGDAEEIADPEIIEQAKIKLRDLGFTTGPVIVWALNVAEIYSITPSKNSKLPLMSAYG
jgi:predicted pyridoxine 5'-phosphate oxidase superfamily flavin-nucleotide-binding protein